MKYLLSFFVFLISNSFANAQIYFSEAYDIEVFKENKKMEAPFTGGFNNAQFSEMDLNQDGIMDLIVTDRFYNRVKPYINNGIKDSIQYTFAPEYATKFPEMDQILITRDYNNDGKMDLYVTGNDILLYENTSTLNGGLSFQLVDKVRTIYNPPGTFPNPLNPNAINYPAIEDIDGDSDMDVIYRSVNRTLDYHRNLSIETNNNYDPIYERRSRCWGSIWFFFGIDGTLDNIRVDTCRYAQGERSKGLKHAEGMSTTAIDIDKNGSMDLVTSDIGTYNMRVMLNADSGLSTSKVNSKIFQIIDSFPSYGTPVNLLYATAYFMDVNNDGKKDLIASSSHANNSAAGPYGKEEIWLYLNTSTTGGYHFELQTKSFLRDETLDFGRNSRPVFIDYNNDGLKDLLIGNGGYLSDNNVNIFIEGLALLENTGTKNNPQFKLISDDYLSLSSLDFGFSRSEFANSTPAVGDLDSDGDDDFLLCQQNGRLYLFEDTSAIGNDAEFKFHSTPYQGIKDISPIISAQLFDVDKDGLLDLVTNYSTQTLFFTNFGTIQNPIFNISLDSIIWQNGDTIRYYIEQNFNYSKLEIGDTLAVENTSNPNNTRQVALILVKKDSLNGSLDCISTISGGVGSNQYDEVNSNATLNFFRNSWRLNSNGNQARIENIFLFEDQGRNQLYAGGLFNTTYRINSFTDSLKPIYNDSNSIITEKVKMANYGYSMFLNGADLNGDSILDLAVGMSTGGIKILYGRRTAFPIFESNPNTLIIGADSSSSGLFYITSNLASWTIDESANWLTLDINSGSFNASITATAVERNASNAQRSENVIINSPPEVPLMVTITQDTIRTIGIKEIDSENKFVLFPNPAQSFFTIQLNEDHITSFQLTVFDVSGKIISQKSFIGSKQNISTEGYPAGIYFVKIKSEQYTRTNKLIIRN